jgi:hypothetical protein
MSKRKLIDLDLNEENKDDEEELSQIKLTENGKNQNLDNEEFEFIKPLSNENKLRPFVDRYFIKYYKIFDDVNHQYAFMHTNK